MKVDLIRTIQRISEYISVGRNTTTSGHYEQASKAKWSLIVGLNSLLLMVPIWVVDFPPLTDLPQHVAQIRMLLEALSHPDSSYTIQWLTPYSLAYASIIIGWFIGTPLLAGKIAFSLIVAVNTIVLHWFVRRQNGSVNSVVLSSVCLYSSVLYWGFIQFYFGFSIFLVWLQILFNPPQKKWKELVLICMWPLFLYFTHILWCAVACFVLLIHDIGMRYRIRQIAVRWSMLIPMLVLVSIWYPQLMGSTFDSPTSWQSTPWARLLQFWEWPDLFLGGLRGSWETCIFCFMLAWIFFGSIRMGKGLFRTPVFYVGILLLLLSVLLPSRYQNTILFHKRWAPFALIMILVSLGEPFLRESAKRLKAIFVWAVLVIHVFLTAAAWMAWEAKEMDGVGEVFHAIPQNARVVGLSYIARSEFLKNYPFIQTFAYAQVASGGELNFSFADFRISLVVYTQSRFQVNPNMKPGAPPYVRWQSGLEWYPERFSAHDARFFDYIIVHADDEVQTKFRRVPMWSYMNGGRNWALYKIRKFDSTD